MVGVSDDRPHSLAVKAETEEALGRTLVSLGQLTDTGVSAHERPGRIPRAERLAEVMCNPCAVAELSINCPPRLTDASREPRDEQGVSPYGDTAEPTRLPLPAVELEQAPADHLEEVRRLGGAGGDHPADSLGVGSVAVESIAVEPPTAAVLSELEEGARGVHCPLSPLCMTQVAKKRNPQGSKEGPAKIEVAAAAERVQRATRVLNMLLLYGEGPHLAGPRESE